MNNINNDWNLPIIIDSLINTAYGYMSKSYSILHFDLIKLKINKQNIYSNKYYKNSEILNKYSDNIWISLIEWKIKYPLLKEKNVYLIQTFWLYWKTWIFFSKDDISYDNVFNIYLILLNQLEIISKELNRKIHFLSSEYWNKIKDITIAIDTLFPENWSFVNGINYKLPNELNNLIENNDISMFDDYSYFSIEEEITKTWFNNTNKKEINQYRLKNIK